MLLALPRDAMRLDGCAGTLNVVDESKSTVPALSHPEAVHGICVRTCRASLPMRSTPMAWQARSSRESAEDGELTASARYGPPRDAAFSEASVCRDADVRSAKPCVAGPELGRSYAAPGRATSHNGAIMRVCVH
jgi:hypothetical protein